MKLDTGADVTTISKTTLNRLGYDNDWIAANIINDPKRTMKSAGVQKKPAYYVILPAVNILGRDLVNWPLHILPQSEQDYPNLLGIDILQYFNFSFDYEKWEFTLVAISKPKNPQKTTESQRIYDVRTAE
ncbi:MAG: retroviral-like aspartic protease family protein [Turicibacter sp.]|nr:retroviral-like aspartic protease family protein [Turicibacter sp.]